MELLQEQLRNKSDDVPLILKSSVALSIHQKGNVGRYLAEAVIPLLSQVSISKENHHRLSRNRFMS